MGRFMLVLTRAGVIDLGSLVLPARCASPFSYSCLSLPFFFCGLHCSDHINEFSLVVPEMPDRRYRGSCFALLVQGAFFPSAPAAHHFTLHSPQAGGCSAAQLSYDPSPSRSAAPAAISASRGAHAADVLIFIASGKV